MTYQSGPRSRFVMMLCIVVLACGAVGASPRPSLAANPIVIENQQSGSSNWGITKGSSDGTGQIKGYASATSVNKGGAITLYVTVNPAQTYTIDTYRIGWYQGEGARLMHSTGTLNGVKQSDCPLNTTTGLIACTWNPSYTLNVPSTWTSGIYLSKLTNAQGYQSYIVFVVRDDSRSAALVYHQPVNTYQAYNNYPSDGVKGKSLYDFNSYGANTVVGSKRAAKVSFDRPYSRDHGAGDFLHWEINLVRWLEKSGYDVTYITNVDLHAAPTRLLGYNGVLSVGHDEYWTKEMRDGVEAARGAGVNLAFLGSNAAYWQGRFESSAAGVANRIFTSYKSAQHDPIQGPTTTVRWRDWPVNRPEQTLIGIQYSSYFADNGNYYPYIVENSGHWAYNGTGLSNGTSVPRIVGYEVDRVMSEYAKAPAATGTFTRLGRSSIVNSSGATDYADTIVYQASSGAWIFSTGTMGWSWALDSYGGHNAVDTRIQQLTANVLQRIQTDAGGNPPTATATLPPTYTPAPGTTATPSLTATPLPPGQSYANWTLQTAGLLGYWRLGETSGTQAADSAGGKHGSYLNGVTLGAGGGLSGDANPAAAFDGSNDKVSLPTLNSVTNFTVEGWTYLNSGATTNTNGNNTLYGGDKTVRILVRPGKPNTSNAAYASVWVNGVEYALQPAASASNLNGWVHWALTRSGGTLTLYRNGVAVGQRSDLPASGTANVSGSIGAQAGSLYFLNGRVDEVAVYSVALSAAQVQAHYTLALSAAAATVDPGAAQVMRIFLPLIDVRDAEALQAAAPTGNEADPADDPAAAPEPDPELLDRMPDDSTD